MSKEKAPKPTKLILIVDDLEANRVLTTEIIKAYIKDQPIDFLHATTTKEAEQIIRNNPVDLVILDENMPGENGTELWTRLSTEPDLQLPPAILATTDINLDLVMKAKDLGMKFQPKPFNIPDLVQTIASHLH